MDPGGLREEALSPGNRLRRGSGRVGAVDAFRGLTIALMILVNNPGSRDFVLPQLRHAAWHGCTVTDLVFPFFLFVMGASMALSLPVEPGVRGPGKVMYLKIIRRTLILFVLGVLANILPEINISHARIFGVLQRIALVYLITSMIAIHFGRWGRAAWTALLFFIYWIAMAWVPFPDMGPDHWAKGSNLAQYLDTLILGIIPGFPVLIPRASWGPSRLR